MSTKFATCLKNLYSKEAIFLFHIKCKLLQFIHKTFAFSDYNKSLVKTRFTAFFTSIMMSHSTARYIAVSILRVCLSVCLYLSWLLALWTKINRIYIQEFSGVSQEISPIFDSHTSTGNILNRRGKKSSSVHPKFR